jgi:hypothetical protein
MIYTRFHWNWHIYSKNCFAHKLNCFAFLQTDVQFISNKSVSTENCLPQMKIYFCHTIDGHIHFKVNKQSAVYADYLVRHLFWQNETENNTK